MTTTEVPLADRLIPVTLNLTDGPVTVTGERTACPYLAITPALTRDGLVDDLTLTHIPTGRSLGRMLLADKSRLRNLAAAVDRLDWNFDDPQAIPRETRDGFLKARRELEFADGEEIATEYPKGWGSGPDAIPGTADGLLSWLLDGYQASSDRLHGDGEDHIPFMLPLRGEIAQALMAADAPGVTWDELGDDERNGWLAKADPIWEVLNRHRLVEVNPHYLIATQRLCDTFGTAYLLAALRRVAPQVADHASAFLAGEWATGEHGEWVGQWRHEIEEGRPLRLPAVPSPEPAEGEFLS